MCSTNHYYSRSKHDYAIDRPRQPGQATPGSRPMSPRVGKKSTATRARDVTRLRRLIGMKGAQAAVGEALEESDGMVCWELDPAYAAWLWPLMQKVTHLVLSVPETDLEPLAAGDCTTPPRPPTEKEKDRVLQLPDVPADQIRVYTLILKGKPASVHKAFPTRSVSVKALRYCRKQVSADAGC